MKRTSHKLIAIIVSLLLIGIGCKSKRLPLETSLEERSKEELLDALKDHNVDYNWWSGTADVSVKSPSISTTGLAKIRIKKDSLVWIQAKKLGIEGARIRITPEEYAVIFRQDRSYSQDHFLAVSDLIGFPVIYDDVQNMMMGNVLLPEAIDSLNSIGPDYIIKQRIDYFDVTYAINSNDLRLQSIELEDKYRRTIEIKYFDYKKVGGVELAHRLNITFDDNKEPSYLNLKFKDIELDVAKRTPFSIPSHYDRIF